ncbi:unnamed protein product [Calicophoron daubneyi]|uniref:HEAT repeat-containing protein 1 n=1 Tax=Calicophoron daubneyi TaxID=300641 RepID=A0AAV2SYD5_CALDB
MTSLSEQLRRLAVPVTASYAVDSVRRKSLVYEDPSKVDTLLCYQDSLKSFEKLVELDTLFSQFRSTLFSETSCRLEMCNLMAAEKRQLDVQIGRFLCFVSPYLRHFVALSSLEWLVHKFQIHMFYLEDYLRCIMPYHETGLFPKFLQLINFQTAGVRYAWLKPYADSGQSLSRKQLVRVCLREATFVPFFNSMIMNAVNIWKGLPSSKLNDITNFFLLTLSALCDAGLSDEKLAGVLSSFQHTLRAGLRAVDCPPFQSAACLVAIQFSTKLNLKKELVMDWIGCLLRMTRPGNEWDSLRVIIRLMRSQKIAILPSELSARHSALLGKLTPSERKAIEDDESSLFDQVDVNQISAEATAVSSAVRSATLVLDTISSPAKSEPIPVPTPTRKKIYKDQELFSCCQSEIDTMHALLAALSGTEKCLFCSRNLLSSCPQLSSFVPDKGWLSNVLLFVLQNQSPDFTSHSKPSKVEVSRARRVMQLVRLAMKAYLDLLQSSQSSCSVNGSCTEPKSDLLGLLGEGLDDALPLLFVGLFHPSPFVRVDTFGSVVFWLTGIRDKQKSLGAVDFRNLNLIRTLNSGNSDIHFDVPSDQIHELLRCDPLPVLSKALPLLIRTTLRLLLSEPLLLCSAKSPVSGRSQLCWETGLQLLTEDTVGELISIPYIGDDLVGWKGFLAILRSPKEASPRLHSLCSAHLSSALFCALGQYQKHTELSVAQKLPDALKSRYQPHLPVHSGQLDVLDTLFDLTHPDNMDFLSIKDTLSRLPLDVQHLDYLLMKLDVSRIQETLGKKSLFVRVSEAREARRLSERLTIGTESKENPVSTSLSHTPADNIRLRLLSTLLTVCTNAIPSLAVNQQTVNTASRVDNPGARSDLLSTALNNLTPDRLISPARSPKLEKDLHLFGLLTPLVSHLVSLLNAEQINRASSTVTLSVDSSDSEYESSEEQVADYRQNKEVLPSQPTRLTIPMDTTLEHKIETFRSDSESLSCSLIRECVYRILVCMTAILTEGGRNRQPARHRHRKKILLSGRSDSSDELAVVQSVVDPVFHCLTMYPEWIALHQQVLLCFVQLSALFPVILCERLVLLVQWVAGSHQLMRLDNVHNLSLLGRLIIVAVPALIHVSPNQTKAALQVLNLFVEGLPGLPSRLSRRRLAFYTGLVRALAQVTSPLSLDYSTFSQDHTPVGTTVSKPSKETKRLRRETQRALLSRYKSGWMGSWLWTTSLVFLNRNWHDEAIAEQVTPLLIDLHNQFTWDLQISAWYECLGFLIWLNKNALNRNPKEARGEHVRGKRPFPDAAIPKPQVVDTVIIAAPKRRRTTSGGKVSDNKSALPESPVPPVIPLTLANFNLPHVTESLVATLFVADTGENEQLSKNSTTPTLDPNSVWSLTARAVQLLNALLSDLTYEEKVKVASADPLGLGAVYGRLVEQTVQLMLCAAVSSDPAASGLDTVDESSSFADSAKQALEGLQKVLIQIHDSVPGSIFIRMVSDLFDSSHRGLRRKALELLAAKLASITTKCPPVPILNDSNLVALPKKIPKRRHSSITLDLTLESGLVRLTAQLASQYNLAAYRPPQSPGGQQVQVKKDDSAAFGSSFSRQSLACLRNVAKLLAGRYPGEFMRTADFLISYPACWWPVQRLRSDDNENNKNEPRGSGSAEARSLACLFAVECLQRLPSHTLSPDASATSRRLGSWLVFALDHIAASCRLSSTPALTLGRLRTADPHQHVPEIVVGSIHSRDEHLMAGLTLLDNLLELAIVHYRSQTKASENSIYSAPSASRSRWFRFATNEIKLSNIEPSQALLRIIFLLGQLDLAKATGANPERNSSNLRQTTALINQIRRLLPHVSEVRSLLLSVQSVLLFAAGESDWVTVHGGLLFLCEFAESACGDKQSGAPQQGQELIRHGFIELCNVEPDLLQQLMLGLISTISEDSMVYTKTKSDSLPSLYLSVATLLAAAPTEFRFGFVRRIIEWSTSVHHRDDRVLNTKATLSRLSAVFRILTDLSMRIAAEDFSELSKQISLADYLILTVNIALGHKRKGLRKLGERLNLKSCVGQLTDGTPPEVLSVALVAVACLRQWLLAELETSACLDVAYGGGSVLEIPSTLVSLLDANTTQDVPARSGSPPVTEDDLAGVLDTFIDAVAGDEALLRPLGAALCRHIMHATHWRTRLSAIRLLKRTFDRLCSDNDGNGVQLSTMGASCLVSDALTALSEALEDDRPEVETAANKLFAQLEQSGLTESKQEIA